MNKPELSVGILSSQQSIAFILNEAYTLAGTSLVLQGEVAVYTLPASDRVAWKTDTQEGEAALPLVFLPNNEQASFTLKEVVFGIDFHWERTEAQRFRGKLQFKAEASGLCAINIVPIETYLCSVISSEMRASASLEFLKAHALISRSWVLAQKEKSEALKQEAGQYQSLQTHDEEYIRWYDREDHSLFDVCADDHCQRYQGINRQWNKQVELAVRATEGEVLTYEGKLCDARFSKCCGGYTEQFERVWEPLEHGYLQSVYDGEETSAASRLDLSKEADFRQFLSSPPPAFCNTNNPAILSQVLNEYDQETTQFFRWEVFYTDQELASILLQKTGWDFGDLLNLLPVERAASGRLVRLQIVGSKKTLVIGKELFIRKALATSHLYSSAFVVDKENNGFKLSGAGWGHGVGLCQIGAAVMGEKGYPYQAILQHYFKGVQISKRY